MMLHIVAATTSVTAATVLTPTGLCEANGLADYPSHFTLPHIGVPLSTKGK
jgi:hypothetical protein